MDDESSVRGSPNDWLRLKILGVPKLFVDGDGLVSLYAWRILLAYAGMNFKK